MGNFFVTLSVLLLLAINFEKGQATYKLAIYEHNPTQKEDVEETILKNLDIYRNQVEKAVDMGVDMIIFPEYGLTTIDAYPEDYAINITITNKVIRELHDMATEHGMYIVVNLLEKSVSNNGNASYYNTDLVFDRKGIITAKYRKINLSEREKQKGLTPGNETITFKTEFGVTFGLFNSDDIFFERPAKTILSNSKVYNVIYPTAWKSYMPLQTSLSIQNGYAITNNVNILAAGYYYPEDGYGSDIFAVNGYTDSYIEYSTNGRLIVKDLIKKPHRKTTGRFKRHFVNSVSVQNLADDVVPSRRFSVDKYKFKPIILNHKWMVEDICYGNFCCTFEVMVNKSTETEIYKLIIYDGVDKLGDGNAHVRICAMLACTTFSSESCGIPSKSNVTFTRLQVSTSFRNDKTVYMPITLTHSLQPINDYSYYKHNFTHFLKTHSSQNNLLVFGIMGRINDNNIISQNMNKYSKGSGYRFNQSYLLTLLLVLVLFVNSV